MSYEYQVRVAELIECLVLSEVEELAILEELDHVYAQATKVDEYEAKAKAFDEISFVFVDSLANDYDDHSIVQNIAKVIENESGESNVKK